ncbi:doublecortin domain-containing protein 5 [Clonorchis sinensis]|uniref:Doublecortin domain-containing protein 5 n=2 Tax=Clonorchis sinensis TaxID=79923 RepID=G7YAP8_CLOSI|nr:doublecortin domain-containing protein 5 [Clonorchis sinensis]
MKQPKLYKIVVLANGSYEYSARVSFTTIDELLYNGTHALRLASIARRAYLPGGEVVHSVKQLRKEKYVYLTCGEPFKDPRQLAEEFERLRERCTWSLTGIQFPADRSVQATQFRISKRFQKLNDRYGYRILAFKNGSSTEEYEVVVESGEFDVFLQLCTSRFQLGAPAKRVFSWDAKEIKQFSEIPKFDRIFATEEAQVHPSYHLLGPVWISKGESLSPSGVYGYLQRCIASLNPKISTMRGRKEQLENTRDGNHEYVRNKAILSMKAQELDEELQKTSEQLDESTASLNTLKAMQAQLSEEVERERVEGCHFTMRHINKIDTNNPLAEQPCLKLKVAVIEGQEKSDFFEVFFNIQRASRGVKDPKVVLHRLLEQISQTINRVNSQAIHNKRSLKRLFFAEGREVREVKQLHDDDTLLASFGQVDMQPKDYSLQLHFMKIFRETNGNLTFKSATSDEISSRTWSPKESPVYEEQFEHLYSDQYGVKLDNEDGVEKTSLEYLTGLTLLQSQDEERLLLAPMLEVGPSQEETVRRTGSVLQLWSLDKSGQIRPKLCPVNLALGLPKNAVKIAGAVNCDNMSSAKSRTSTVEDIVTGFRVALLEQDDEDKFQLWRFSTDGYVHNQGDESLVLTCLYKCEQKSSESNIGASCFIAACHILDRPQDSCQRWGIKQKRWSTFGQWRFSKVANPEWHKLALTWPIDREGEVNEALIWPVEGYLTPFAPPLDQRSSYAGGSSCNPKRLRVLRNGDAIVTNAIYVTGPKVVSVRKGKVLSQNEKVEGEGKNKGNQKSARVGSGEINQNERRPRVASVEFTTFLDSCTTALRLVSAARRLFDQEGNEHFTLENLPRDTLVHVSCGEPFINVWQAQQEAKLRNFFSSVHTIVKRAEMYVDHLREMKEDWVLTLSPRLIEGAVIVLQKIAPAALHSADENAEHTFVNLRKGKQMFSRTTNAGSETDQKPVEKTEATARNVATTSKTSSVSSNSRLQRFGLRYGGVIYPLGEPNLALTMMKGAGDDPVIQLKRLRYGEETQQFRITPDGFIRCGKYVLCLERPDNGWSEGFTNCGFAMVDPEYAQFGRALQMFQYDHQSGLIYAFSTSMLDREITVANMNNLCTSAVISLPIEQPGFKVTVGVKRDMGKKSKLNEGHPLNGAYVCPSCSKSLLGQFKLTPVEKGDGFVCAFSKPSEYKTSEPGSLGLFQGGCLDLSTFEARYNVSHWSSLASVDTHDIKKMKQARTRLLHAVEHEPKIDSLRLLVYNNGDARLLAPVLCIGSSIQGLLEQSTVRLGLANPVTTFYTIDGTPIHHVDDLHAWIEQNIDSIHKQALLWHKWCSQELLKNEPEEITDSLHGINQASESLEETIHRHSLDQRVSETAYKRVSSTKPVSRVIYTGHPDVKRIMESGILDGTKFGSRNNVCLTPVQLDLPDADRYPTVTLTSHGRVFQIGDSEGPGENNLYMLVIKIVGLDGLKRFLTKTNTNTTEGRRLRLVTAYEIFGNQIRSDIFQADTSSFEDIAQIQIQSRPGPLKNYLTNVCPKLQVNILPVLDDSKGDNTQDNTDLQPSHPIAHCYISLESLNVIDDVSNSQISSTPCKLLMNSPTQQSPKESEDGRGDEGQEVGNKAEYGFSACVYLIKKRSSDTEKHMVPPPTEDESTQNEENLPNWVTFPIEVWASCGEEFVPLHKIYDDPEWIRSRLEAEKKADESSAPITSDSSTSFNSLRDDGSNSRLQDPQPAPERAKPNLPLTAPLYKQPQRKRIFVYKNREVPSKSVLVWGDNLDAMMQDASSKLGCTKNPDRFCTLDGNRINQLKDLKQDQIVCLVCCGERFIVPKEIRQAQISANWVRARRKYGPEATDIVVQTRTHPFVNVDPFELPSFEQQKQNQQQQTNQRGVTTELKRVYVFENGKPVDTAQPITGSSLGQLLGRAYVMLRLPQRPVCFYTPEGTKITSFQQVMHDDVLAVSTTGQRFIRQPRSK